MNDGFETNGTHEFIAEIFDFDCNYAKNEFVYNNDYELNKKNEVENEVLINNEIQISPNPFSSEIEITATSNIINSIKLIDIMGKTIMQEEFYSPINYWKIINKNLSSGVYLLEIKNNQTNQTYKLIKN
ncbi:MAG: hypothetical protein A2X08_08645 [Bacteroidetes bacterium GWA2_32_17]|nr:MAG: hypothetical protein A2X08_08645 [Bacteroidetes bacterium GWA2_32_17]